MTIIRQILFILYRFFYIVHGYFYIKPKKIDYHKLYLEEQKQAFLTKCDASLNSNIDVLYDFDKSKEIMKTTGNSLEKVWKTRLLYQNVLLKNNNRVNVMMYYDPYKHGFSYYCDNLVDYQSLNVLAMKYVRYFECMEFFVDEKILNEVNGKSVFLENLKKDKIKSKIKRNFKNKVNDNELIKNKYIYLGKMLNFTWLNKENPVAKNIGYSEFKELFK
tara:strand:- start:1562 stop:2215 length:654 start_codon:yes stop_codon:yes gene_type:complete